MDLLIPEGGLLFWMTLVFVIVFLILWKFGFPAIVKMIDERKAYIDESLRKAKEANDKLQNIQKEGEAMLQEARDKQAAILREAARIAAEGVDEDYFRRIRKASFGANLRGLNSFENIAVTLTEGYFHGYDPLRFPEVFESITPEDVAAFLKTNVTAERMVLSRIVPKQ